MKKRILSLFLAAAMLLSLFPATAKAAELDNGLQYEVYADHVEITDYTGSATEVVIPAEIEGLPVTSIGNYAFFNCLSLTSVSIPDSVTAIGNNAFNGCSSLTSIAIPDGVTTIGREAFADCLRLTSVSLPDSVTSIGSAAFCGCCALTDISIPDGVTSIGDSAFGCCESLSSLTIPGSVTSIGSAAFSGCYGLESITFLGDAPAFGDYAFEFVTTTVYYPADNATWTEDVMQDYDGTLTWVAQESVENPFQDVPAGSYYEEPVLWALENGITAGVSETSFNPDGQCLRPQVVTFLWRAAGCPEPESTVNPFADINPASYYYKAVLWAVEEGITAGMSATSFGTYTACSRAQVITFLWRAAGRPEPESTVNPFTDVDENDYFYKAILWGVENKIVAGMSATEFGSALPCTRAQVVSFLYRAYH